MKQQTINILQERLVRCFHNLEYNERRVAEAESYLASAKEALQLSQAQIADVEADLPPDAVQEAREQCEKNEAAAKAAQAKAVATLVAGDRALKGVTL